MHKDQLKGKYIMYIDKNSAYRIAKVVKVNGKILTIKNAYGIKHRIHPNKHKILGRVKKRKVRFKTQSEYLEEITW